MRMFPCKALLPALALSCFAALPAFAAEAPLHLDVFTSTPNVPLMSTTGMFSVKDPWNIPAIPVVFTTKPPCPSVMLISVFVPSVKIPPQSERLLPSRAVSGSELQRPPKGFDPAHPHIEYLKHRSFFVWTEVKLDIKTEKGWQVLSGLAKGDRVVTTANFLLDSESSLKAALSTMAAKAPEHKGH